MITAQEAYRAFKKHFPERPCNGLWETPYLYVLNDRSDGVPEYADFVCISKSNGKIDVQAAYCMTPEVTGCGYDEWTDISPEVYLKSPDKRAS